jgi:hypothetical protein
MVRRRRGGNKVTGYRRNPFLYVYNPPLKALTWGDAPKFRIEVVGIIASKLHDIRYEHAEDGKPYQHDFETDTTALACVLPSGEHVVLLRGANGQNVWEDR